PLLERWQEELRRLIRTSDVTVAVLTPSFLQSRWCEWEVEQVTLLRKRLAPVVAAAQPSDLHVPGAISCLNYVYFTPPHDFPTQVSKLVAALNTNIEWVKEHTRLGELALRWKERGKAPELLLCGNELEDADQWAVSRPLDAPALSEVQMELIQT